MNELIKTVNEQFGFAIIEAKGEVGYENLNFILKDESGNKFVLKLHPNNLEWEEEIKAQAKLLEFTKPDNTCLFPQVHKTLSNKYSCEITFKERKYHARLLSFIPGSPWANAEDNIAKMEIVVGKAVARLDQQLLEFHSNKIKGKINEWDLKSFLHNKPLLSLIEKPEEKKLVHYYLLKFKENVQDKIPHLRHSYIHGDVNDYNTMVLDGEISGIIDFGDCAYTPLINELGIMLAYFMMGRNQPLESASRILKAYHTVLPLNEQEIKLLAYLIPARWCTTVLHAAKGRIEDPDNAYRSVSEQDAWNLLRFWIKQNPLQIQNQFLETCGFETVNLIEDLDLANEKKRRSNYFSPALSISYIRSIKMESAAFQYMFTADGNAILDAYNNIIQVGHCHPKVVEAGQAQLAKLNTNTRYYYNALHLYAEQLLSKFPPHISRVFFTNSGSASSDLAIRIARTLTHRQKIAVMEHGYHGNTQLGINISHYKFAGKGGSGPADNILPLKMPDPVWGKEKNETENEFSERYASQGIQILQEPLAAWIFESIIGCGGQVPLPAPYAVAISEHVREQGGFIIADEVQTGFGRTGDHFWGFERLGISPDMVVLGKPMGNGHPLSAVVCTEEIAEQFANGMEYFSSFAGNPVSCEIGRAVLNVIEEEGLQQNAKIVGNYLQKELIDLSKLHPELADVRGAGLFLGVEISNKEQSIRNPKLAYKIKNELREELILVSTDGPADSVLKIKPPLCFNKENADELVEKLSGILKS